MNKSQWTSRVFTLTAFLRPRWKIRPVVGFKAAKPQKCAGTRKLPPMSEPRPKIEPPAPIKAPSPPEDPPGVRVLSIGCVVRPKTGFEQA